MGALTWTLVGLLALFGGVDVAAKATGYRYGETFSALVRSRRWTRAGAGAVLVVLFLHLVLRLF